MHWSSISVLLFTVLGCAGTAHAQRLPFERSFEVGNGAVVDVGADRGRIEIMVGEPGRVRVLGSVTVRVGLDVPANAVELARGVAAHPPIELEANTVRMRPPSGDLDRRAVTVAYSVWVPPDTRVVAVSDSGATRVHGVSGPVSVRTHSAAIELGHLGGTVDVTTGSGAVKVDDIGGDLTVRTSSSAFTGRALRAGVTIHSESGAVEAGLAGPGDVRVETGSSSVVLTGATGAVSVSTRSGRVRIAGDPGRAWEASTGSGSMDITLGRQSAVQLEATSRSGSVSVDGPAVQGVVSKRRVAATIGAGGPLLRLTSRSGSIRIGHTAVQ